MTSDDEITVAEGQHKRHVVLICGSAAFARLMARIAGDVPWPEGVAADELTMLEIHKRRSAADGQPAEQDWRSRAALVGCTAVALVVAVVFIAGVFAIIDWFRG